MVTSMTRGEFITLLGCWTTYRETLQPERMRLAGVMMAAEIGIQ
jgi:hypothetical protein